MHPADDISGNTIQEKTGKKPLICKLILAMALTYFLIITLLFLAALIFSGEILRSMSFYYDPEKFKAGNIVAFILSGFLLYTTTSAGIILLFLNRRSGFYLFFLTTLVIFVFDLIFMDFDWLRYMLHTGFIFLVGLLHFSKRCYS